MNQVLVDSSIWIDFFHGDYRTADVSELIEYNKICINKLILSELIPSLVALGETKLIKLLHKITLIPVHVKWDNIIDLQTLNIRNGINKVGIADMILLQNILEHDVEFYTRDKHFFLMKKIHPVKIYGPITA